MKKSIQSTSLAFVILTFFLLYGCTTTPTPILPTITPVPTNTPIPPTVIPATVTLTPFVLFQDDFSKNSARWEIFGPWKVQDGMFQIDHNGWAGVFVNPLGDIRQWNNFSYEVDHMCEKGGIFSSIHFRGTQAGSYFLRLHWSNVPTFVGFGKNDTDGKNDTGLRAQEYELVTNHWYHLKVTAIDNHIWNYIDNQLVVEYIDNQDPLLYGNVNLTVYTEEKQGRIQCAFDNVKLTEEINK